MTDECALHKVHNPSVSRVEKCYAVPQFLQDRLRAAGKSVPRKAVKVTYVCPTGKANVEEYTRYLLGERDPLTVRVGSETKAAAQAAVLIYEVAVMKTGK